jgi:phosphoribosylanthranilate isomerase
MTKVKICGITNLYDAVTAIDAGADMLGFIQYRKSPRYVTPECAAGIIQAIGMRGRVGCVGVFVDAAEDEIRRTVEQAQFDLVQLHGVESPELVRALAPRVYKALRPRDQAEASADVERFRVSIGASEPAFIVDAYDPKQFGGTGVRADWDIATSIARQYPILLAGGLTPENVGDAVDAVEPWGVDVSSGVERAPGNKDPAKVNRFIQAAKGG